MQTKKLGLTPTLVVLLAVFGLAMLVGVILLMMFVRTGIAHSPEQSSLETHHRACRLAEHRQEARFVRYLPQENMV
ncbi:MAG TPA: hypothetical protein VF133_12350 [Terriglobales bacterium]